MRIVDPSTTYKAPSAYTQAVVHGAAAERIVVSGQLGLKPDGTVEEGLENQMVRAFQNVFAVMAEAGFERRHLIRAIIYCTVPGSVAVYRAVRDRMLDGHLCANTYIEISGLASKDHLVEIEAEAVRE